MTHPSHVLARCLPTSTWVARGLFCSVGALLSWSVWARAGTVVSLQGPLPWIGLFILFFLALDRWGHGYQKSGSPPSPLPDLILFWAGLAFLVLLSIQWWNSPRYPYFHPFDQRWVFTPPPHPGWPWAVDRNDAAEMLRWFFPAWTLMLALRYARRPNLLTQNMAWFLIINAGLLATFGIIQVLSGTQKIFWITPLSTHFFASFGYENHAASYFALLFAFTTGRLLQLSSPGFRSRQPGKGPWSEVVFASICAGLCLAGMALSFSRTGLALAVGLSGIGLLMAARLFWPHLWIAQRVAIAAALIMGVATFFFVVASLGGEPLAKEAGGLYRAHLAHEMDIRLFMVHSASQMWANEPWFGVGGWGYRHFLPVYALNDAGTKLSLGGANVHQDAMQFLCEFGIVGFGFMLATTFAFAWPLFRQIRRQLSPGLLLAGAGLLAVMCHSLIDLPFRSPGILYAWLAVIGTCSQNHDT